MKVKFVLAATVAVAAMITLAACDSGSKPAETPAAAAPATPSSAPPAPPPSPPPPAPTEMLGLAAPYASEADWISACVTTGKLDKTVCECVGKAATKELGPKGYYQWVWEGYVQNAGMGRVRGKKWFEDNKLDEKKFAAAAGKCFVSSPAKPN